MEIDDVIRIKYSSEGILEPQGMGYELVGRITAYANNNGFYMRILKVISNEGKYDHKEGVLDFFPISIITKESYKVEKLDSKKYPEYFI
jgi:hypothetical protein